MNNPCKECCQTKFHCCKMDIPLTKKEALYLLSLAEKRGIPRVGIQKHYNGDWMMLLQGNLDGSDINVQEENCVFFINNKCSIYKNRPSICRIYGTEYIKCRFVDTVFTTKEKISACSYEDIIELDNQALVNSELNKILKG